MSGRVAAPWLPVWPHAHARARCSTVAASSAACACPGALQHRGCQLGRMPAASLGAAATHVVVATRCRGGCAAEVLLGVPLRCCWERCWGCR
eukprot:101223-Chlamydomonas_euryale.AAC.1